MFMFVDIRGVVCTEQTMNLDKSSVVPSLAGLQIQTVILRVANQYMLCGIDKVVPKGCYGIKVFLQI